ncbi:MAG: ferritin-like domain-containing protein [Waterburya sp.]
MYQPTRDLAGEVCFRPNFFQTKTRINYLIDEYLNYEQLGDRLEDLPQQFRNPQPRKWQTINWQDIHPEQVIGLELDIFLSILQGALDTEAPIREYAQTSRKYLEPIHSSLARLVGGRVAANGTMIELGLWEKEERQHTPALSKLYQLLAKESITPQVKTATGYQPRHNPYQDLYCHGLDRIINEYGATCLYLWLMSHTTGTTQQVLGELLQDEINHLAKFWGMGMWLYPDGAEQLIRYLLSQIHTILPVSYEATIKPPETIKSTFQRMMSVLNWQSWSVLARGELVYTFIWVLKQMWCWSGQLTPEYLHSCCGTPEFFDIVSCNQPKVTIF